VVEPGTRGGKKDVVRWIGVFFDRKLSFNHHVHTKLASARRTFAAVSSLVRHERGLSPQPHANFTTHVLFPGSITEQRYGGIRNRTWNDNYNNYRMMPLNFSMATATPPPVFATTSTETIDFSIGFGFAALIYVSL
jgi:hypothetical protein